MSQVVLVQLRKFAEHFIVEWKQCEASGKCFQRFTRKKKCFSLSFMGEMHKLGHIHFWCSLLSNKHETGSKKLVTRTYLMHVELFWILEKLQRFVLSSVLCSTLFCFCIASQSKIFLWSFKHLTSDKNLLGNIHFEWHADMHCNHSHSYSLLQIEHQTANAFHKFPWVTLSLAASQMLINYSSSLILSADHTERENEKSNHQLSSESGNGSQYLLSYQQAYYSQ